MSTITKTREKTRTAAQDLIAALGLSLADLSGLTGLSISAISNTLAGRRASRRSRTELYVAVRDLAAGRGHPITYDQMWGISHGTEAA